MDENAGYCRCSRLSCVKADFNSSSKRIFISMRCSATSKRRRNEAMRRMKSPTGRGTNCISRYWQRNLRIGGPDLHSPLRLNRSLMMYKEKTSREISEQSMPRHRYVETMKNDYHRRRRRMPYLSPRKTSTASFIVGRWSLIWKRKKFPFSPSNIAQTRQLNDVSIQVKIFAFVSLKHCRELVKNN